MRDLTEREARAAWSRIALPEDLLAERMIRNYGAVDALEEAADQACYVEQLKRLDLRRDRHAAERCHARVVIPGDPDWPEGLDDLEFPPYCLWVRGTLQTDAHAIVGSRSATAYGEAVAADIAAGFADRKVSVVSGGAFGVDAAAHRGALGNGGHTVAVLASGVDRPFPSAHAALLARIANSGAIVSEVAPGSAPTRRRLLARNRIIAAMSTATVVVEAGLRSGSLSTARHAWEISRPVGAVPGPITSVVSNGCHQLIRDGKAVLVTNVEEAMQL